MVFDRRSGGSDVGQAGTGAGAVGGAVGGAIGARTLTGAATPARPADPVREITTLLNGRGGADAAWAKLKTLEEAQQSSVVSRLSAAARSRLATDLQRSDVNDDAGYSLLRRCFDATPVGEVRTLCRWTALRFNLTVTRTSDNTGAPWDKRGLRRCWDVLQALPAAHVEDNADLNSLTRYRSTSVEGWASDSGEAAIGYGGRNRIDTELETGAFTDARDPLRGKNIFDATVRHEVGHRVDSSVGGPAYCATDAGGGWKTWDSIDGMAERLVNASGGKISSWPDAGEKRAIIGALQAVIAARRPNQINTRLAALPFLSRHATDAAQRAKLDEIKGDEAIAALRVAYQSPWDMANGGIELGGRIYQESYDWPQWVSYKQDARARKFSRYQFRAPGEWFAEAYATYYQPPGDKGALMAGLDPATKTWFDANVDPRRGAGGTVPPGRAGAGAAGAAAAGATAGGGAATAGGGAPAGTTAPRAGATTGGD